MAESVVSFLAAETSSQASRQFYEFALSDVVNTRENVYMALVAAVEGENFAGIKSQKKDFSELLFSEDLEFENAFRVTRKTVRILVGEMRTAGYSVGIEKDVLLVLYCLGSKSPDWSQIGQVFDTTPHEAVSTFVKSCILIVGKLKPRMIVWPDGADEEEIRMGLARRFRFPRLMGVLGAVALQRGTIALEIVVDHLHKFSWASAAIGVTDVRSLMESTGLTSRLIDVEDDEAHLVICGSYYPQRGRLLTPYLQPINSDEHRFNVLHSKAMSLISDTYRLLVSRFPLLTDLRFKDREHSKVVIEAACAIHNLCVRYRDMAPVANPCSSLNISDL